MRPTTPDFYIYDSNLKLVYRGQLDDSRVTKSNLMEMILEFYSMSFKWN